MPEFTRNDFQTVAPNQPVALDTSIGCTKGYVYHRNGSGIVTLRGVTSNCFARYQVTFNGNILASDSPRAIVQVVSPIVLNSRLVEENEDCTPTPVTLPTSIAGVIGGDLLPIGSRRLLVTLGLFTIVQLERKVQMLVPAYDFCVPGKECVTTATDPPTQANFFNVTSTAIIDVPKGCCTHVSVENTSESATPATTPAPSILVQNANMTVTRIA